MDVMKIELGEKLSYKGEELQNFMREKEVKLAEQAKQQEEWEEKLRNRDEKLQQLEKKLEALRERRPPWPRQIITLILPTVKMLSLGCERLPTPLKKKKKKKNGFGSFPAP